MSGIVGILNLDGAPVDPELLGALTTGIAPRGPDAREIWKCGPVGLGHTLLRTTWESATEHQPLTLDDRTWIAADCRVDARADLIRALGERGSAPAKDAPDPELILRAYNVWGERCVEWLLGDFSFVVWDAPRRTLFCARDHFGVRPFFFAECRDTLVVANDLDCLRQHPAVTNELDDLAIADFLVFGHALDRNSTSFRAVRRLPPGHTLTAHAGNVVLRRYWEIPLEEEIKYRRRGEYVEHFLALLETATRDRLRTNRVSVLMSGGLDSPTVSAMAHRVLSAAGQPFDMRAHTVVFDRIVPDQERRYSQLVADALGIAIHHYALDDNRLPPAEPEPDWSLPEPGFIFDSRSAGAVYRGAAATARVLLRADGADPLIDAGSAVRDRFDQGRYGHLLREFLWLGWARRQPPRMGLRSLMLERVGRTARRQPGTSPYPNWLAPDLERRLDLRERWRAEVTSTLPRPGLELQHAYWSKFFEAADPGSMGLAAELRYPFIDVRLARFLLRLPPLPWAAEKSLLRIAMRGVLPRAVLARSKAPLAGNPWARLLPPAETCWWTPYLAAMSGLDRFVSIPTAAATVERTARAAQGRNDHADIDLLRLSLRPLSLNRWLRRAPRMAQFAERVVG